MSERKAINKYYPPDYDPSKIPKKKNAKKTGPASWPTVRLMTPFSLKCTTCGEYISKSKKFNAKKETTDETYFGVKVLCFHIRCPQCFAEIVFRTDPKTADFETVSGAVRNYAPKKQEQKIETFDETLQRLEREEKQELLEETGETEETALEQLERRLAEQQREQQLADELEELRSKNSRREEANGVDNKLVLKAAALIQNKREREDDDDGKEAREAFESFKKKQILQAQKVKLPVRKKNKLGVIIKKKV
ncbi:unnamed protein product [Kuraishia capsulata CBS 1993]|uniref:Splicing factor YJU2 n=1 Tax=Kuraishia capsulata CBS 1993 TaxID=1382522 RepID=W6MJ87_9ASCO|nr:uncharacterized protein KUCA_T00002546001 [Kuraishia capsulata CBS 1993]CDK26574.1 unnamed protein product [Kuraishia capsulata CBS 1993]